MSTASTILSGSMTFTPESLPDLDGKVYLVTGGNTGMYVVFYGVFWLL
jgi:hypothetical protein